ncbi:MAG: VOC family protein [Chthonomonas sp.]|nr:VOC family protein [Chthonomonas sp.]
MKSTLSQIILDVANLERSLEFYAGVLKMRVSPAAGFGGHPMAHLSNGETELLLIQGGSDGADYDRRGGVILSFQISSIADVLSNSEQMGLTVLRGMEGGSNQVRSVLIADPDNYAILLSEAA